MTIKVHISIKTTDGYILTYSCKKRSKGLAYILTPFFFNYDKQIAINMCRVMLSLGRCSVCLNVDLWMSHSERCLQMKDEGRGMVCKGTELRLSKVLYILDQIPVGNCRVCQVSKNGKTGYMNGVPRFVTSGSVDPMMEYYILHRMIPEEVRFARPRTTSPAPERESSSDSDCDAARANNMHRAYSPPRATSPSSRSQPRDRRQREHSPVPMRRGTRSPSPVRRDRRGRSPAPMRRDRRGHSPVPMRRQTRSPSPIRRESSFRSVDDHVRYVRRPSAAPSPPAGRRAERDAYRGGVPRETTGRPSNARTSYTTRIPSDGVRGGSGRTEYYVRRAN